MQERSFKVIIIARDIQTDFSGQRNNTSSHRGKVLRISVNISSVKFHKKIQKQKKDKV